MIAHGHLPAASTVLSVALFGVSILLWPTTIHAFVIPDKITLVANDTIHVIEPSESLPWFEQGQQRVYDPVHRPEIEVPRESCQALPFLCTAFLPRDIRTHFITQETLRLNREAATVSLNAILDNLERDPLNAKLGLDANGLLTVTSEAIPGIRIDHDQAIRSIFQLIENNPPLTLSVTLPTTTIPAKVSSETLGTLGLHTKIAEGVTNFRGSPKNRIFNIHRAIEQFDGIVIAPGEEFSFVQHLGDVDGEHGYLPELVIKNNKTEPEFGGGICQVSTTVFRAALNAGLEITERRNHAYPVQYYKPYGMDATVYIPRPDLKFKNNTPGAILMLPQITGTQLSFTFYGTSDGRIVTIDGPHILESNPDGSMRTLFTQTVKSFDGTTLVDATFASNYKSPSLFPHPGDEVLTEKPKNWSSRQWKEYKAIHP